MPDSALRPAVLRRLAALLLAFERQEDRAERVERRHEDDDHRDGEEQLVVGPGVTRISSFDQKPANGGTPPGSAPR